MDMKLHLGCGTKKIHGFVNVDIDPKLNPDVIADAFKLPDMELNSVSLIYSCHLLEHAPKEKTIHVLKRWFDLLKCNGILRLSVPDLEALFRYYICERSISQISGLLYGGQRNGFDFHYNGWDEMSLVNDLTSVGFVNVHRYDWRSTEHAFIDDYSQCYLPKLSYSTRKLNGKIDGHLMSLNVEARKP